MEPIKTSGYTLPGLILELCSQASRLGQETNTKAMGAHLTSDDLAPEVYAWVERKPSGLVLIVCDRSSFTAPSFRMHTL